LRAPADRCSSATRSFAARWARPISRRRLDTLVASIRAKLFRLPTTCVCYPGHEGETTIGESAPRIPSSASGVGEGR
jgi:hypothetical protein